VELHVSMNEMETLLVLAEEAIKPAASNLTRWS